MRNIVGAKAKDAQSNGQGNVQHAEGSRGGAGSGAVDIQSYPARWRIVKLVAFELVRGDPGILTTTGGTAASADSLATGSAKYKIGRRKDSRRSIVGDKLKKIRALQNGVYKKISWLPEWWWDLVPAINPFEEAQGQVWDTSTLSDVGDLLEEDGSSVGVWTGTEEESFLDQSTGSEQLSDPPAAAITPLNAWTYDVECGTGWMPTDSVRMKFLLLIANLVTKPFSLSLQNYIKGVFERTRQKVAAEQEIHNESVSLHVRLLLQKQRAEEEDELGAEARAEHQAPAQRHQQGQPDQPEHQCIAQPCQGGAARCGWYWYHSVESHATRTAGVWYCRDAAVLCAQAVGSDVCDRNRGVIRSLRRQVEW